MSFRKQKFVLALSCALFTTTAAAIAGSQKPVVHQGSGRGHVTMPTSLSEGWFNAELLDENHVAKFTIDAQMTSWIPSTSFGPGVRMLQGGIYGYLREAPAPGVFYIAPLQPIAVVQGSWFLERNGMGDFELDTFVRRADGSLRHTGTIMGTMQTHLIGGGDQVSGVVAQVQAKKKASVQPAGPSQSALVRAKQRQAAALAQGVGSAPETVIASSTSSSSASTGRASLAALPLPRRTGASASAQPGSALLSTGTAGGPMASPVTQLRIGQFKCGYKLIH